MPYKENNKAVALGTLLQMVLFTMKLLQYLDWSWGWIVSPIWLPVLLFTIGQLLRLLCMYLWEIDRHGS